MTQQNPALEYECGVLLYLQLMRVERFERRPVPRLDEVTYDKAGRVPLVPVGVTSGSREAQSLYLSVCDLLVLCRRDKRERNVPESGTGRHDANASFGCGLVGRVRLSAPQDEVFGQHKVHLVLAQTIRPRLVGDELLDEAAVVVLGLSAVNERG